MSVGMTDSEQIEIIREFSNEVRDLLEQLEPSIIELGRSIEDGVDQEAEELRQTLNNIFRLFHSVKGTAGFLQFGHITETAHVAENLLDRIRTGDLQILPAHIDLFCEACDFTLAAVDHVEKHLNDQGMAERAARLVREIEAELAGDRDFSAGRGAWHTSATPPVAGREESCPSPAPSPGGAINRQALRIFLDEAEEQLQEIEQGLLAWPNAVDRDEVLGKLFCTIHSFKGNCGFMNLADPERLSHCMETALEAVKSGAAVDVGRLSSVFLKQLDALKDVLVDIAGGGNGGIKDLDRYLQQLRSLFPGEPVLAEAGPSGVGAGSTNGTGPGRGTLRAAFPDETADGEEGTETAPEMAMQRRQDIRVDVRKLDELITLVGELVIAENMLVNNPDLEGLELGHFHKSAQHMTKIVKELQEIAMTIRMIPVAGIFRRMARLVHDLSRKTGKKVDLRISGENTEVDKTVIENVVDPLIHILRNAMDHGLESPEERRRAGKPESGLITLSASHEEGDVMIVVRDDGRGLDRARILAKARQRGLVEGDGSQLGDRQVFDLVFLPGFSTAERVTEVSGRGVGMDVVQQNLAKIRGRVAIRSEAGKGTMIRLRIPLTMAIIDGMLIRTGSTLNIIPILAIRESFRPGRDAVTITPDGQELVRLRDHLLPVIRLHELHDIEPDHRELDQGILVVVEARDRHVCLLVDEIMGQQQTVIKGLSKYITDSGSIKGISGCTILGDGNICLILDVPALIEDTEQERE